MNPCREDFEASAKFGENFKFKLNGQKKPREDVTRSPKRSHSALCTRTPIAMLEEHK
jgi:hypothetical protein